jgi:predicted lipoprotein
MRDSAALGTLALLALAASGGCRVATVRPLDEKAAPAEGATAALPFDASAFVDEVALPEVRRAVAEAREAGEVVRGAATVPVPQGGGTRHAVVRGRGRVTDVDARSRSGTATVELDGEPGARVVLQIGPVLTGTAIRDAVPALGFDRFVNQIQHADVGNELNARVEREALAGLDRAGLRGRRVSFAGMAAFEEGRPLTVTPVRLEVEDGR